MVKYDSQKIDYQLHIDSGYYNALDIEGFSRMMKDPSYPFTTSADPMTLPPSAIPIGIAKE